MHCIQYNVEYQGSQELYNQQISTTAVHVLHAEVELSSPSKQRRGGVFLSSYKNGWTNPHICAA